MGFMDSLRAMFGGSKAEKPKEDEVQEELAVESVQHDIERERDAGVEPHVETPSSLDDRP